MRKFLPKAGSVSRTTDQAPRSAIGSSSDHRRTPGPNQTVAAHVTVPIELEEEDIDRRLDAVIQWDECTRRDEQPQDTGSTRMEPRKQPRCEPADASTAARAAATASPRSRSSGTGSRKKKKKASAKSPRKKRTAKKNAGAPKSEGNGKATKTRKSKPRSTKPSYKKKRKSSKARTG